MRYEGYTTTQRVDDILDKISKHGIDSISQLERDFLDAHKIGEEEKIHQILNKVESEKFFEDDAGMFNFEYESTEIHGEDFHYLGTLTCPDIIENGKTIGGRLVGRIIYHPKTGLTSPDFEIEVDGKEYDAFDFSEGYEYELDSFIDYVVGELENKED